MIDRYSRPSITPEDIYAVEDVLIRGDGMLTQGPRVEAFEAALCEYTGARHAIAVSNGTIALYLLALSSRLQFESEVVTSPLSFVATANAFMLAGHHVTFRDVDAETGMLMEDRKTDVVVPVHFAGRACDVLPFNLNGDVVEDACHALGAMDYDGCSRVGSCAHSLATVFSFHPVKPITTGEGGAITTNDDDLAAELRSLRDHGREGGVMVRLGINGRMSEIQAALGLSQLARCEEMRIARTKLALTYGHIDSDLARLSEAGAVTLPEASLVDAWHLYPVRIKNGRRDEVKAALNARGIGAQAHYSPPIHLHPFYRQLGYKPGDFPNAEAWASEELSLPLHAGMSVEDVRTVVDALREVL